MKGVVEKGFGILKKGFGIFGLGFFWGKFGKEVEKWIVSRQCQA